MQSKGIVVSVACITYNHAPYIRQCLEGFLMQKTNFPIEIIVHDDASTDGTDDIIREYALKYPELFKVILQEENQYSKGVDVLSLVFERSAGKYIALCEGDDYWTDPLKLQKQVDFLEQNPLYVMCSHRYDYYYQLNDTYDGNHNDTSRSYSLDFLLEGGWLFHPLTVMFKRSAIKNSAYYDCKVSMDAVLFYFILKQGPGYYLKDNMAVYRVHNGGVWSGINSHSRMLVEYKARLAIYEVDKSDDAAKFIKSQFLKDIGREFFLREWAIVSKALLIVCRHFGLLVTLKIILKRIFMGKFPRI